MSNETAVEIPSLFAPTSTLVPVVEQKVERKKAENRSLCSWKKHFYTSVALVYINEITHHIDTPSPVKASKTVSEVADYVYSKLLVNMPELEEYYKQMNPLHKPLVRAHVSSRVYTMYYDKEAKEFGGVDKIGKEHPELHPTLKLLIPAVKEYLTTRPLIRIKDLFAIHQILLQQTPIFNLEDHFKIGFKEEFIFGKATQ